MLSFVERAGSSETGDPFGLGGSRDWIRCDDRHRAGGPVSIVRPGDSTGAKMGALYFGRSSSSGFFDSVFRPISH